MMWRGIHKLTEEAGEVIQIAGKLGAFPEGEHPDGAGNLKTRMEDELADIAAASAYFIKTNGLDAARMQERARKKLGQFEDWGLDGIRMPDHG